MSQHTVILGRRKSNWNSKVHKTALATDVIKVADLSLRRTLELWNFQGKSLQQLQGKSSEE